MKEEKIVNNKISIIERNKKARQVTLIGFFINAILTIFKCIAGILGNSGAMIADGIHSLSDFFTDIVVLLGFKFTDKPADMDHNYGHGKYETLATLIIGVALLITGLNIFSDGIFNVYNVIINNEVIPRPKIIAVIAAITSIVSKELLFQYTRLVGDKIKSQTVIANGWHHRSDALSSIGTFIGISGAYMLGNQWTILDPVAAIIVSAFIFKVSFEIMLPALNELLEASLSNEENRTIISLINDNATILSYHNLRTRRIGPSVAIEAHLIFNNKISLYAAHEVSDKIELKLKELFGSRSIITLHLEPNKE